MQILGPYAQMFYQESVFGKQASWSSPKIVSPYLENQLVYLGSYILRKMAPGSISTCLPKPEFCIMKGHQIHKQVEKEKNLTLSKLLLNCLRRYHVRGFFILSFKKTIPASFPPLQGEIFISLMARLAVLLFKKHQSLNTPHCMILSLQEARKEQQIQGPISASLWGMHLLNEVAGRIACAI